MTPTQRAELSSLLAGMRDAHTSRDRHQIWAARMDRLRSEVESNPDRLRLR